MPPPVTIVAYKSLYVLDAVVFPIAPPTATGGFQEQSTVDSTLAGLAGSMVNFNFKSIADDIDIMLPRQHVQDTDLKLDNAGGNEVTAADLRTHLDDVATNPHNVLHTQITDFDTGVQQNRIDQMSAPTAPWSGGSQNIQNVLDPVLDQDAATKNYIDNTVINSLNWKTSVRVATTANVSLTGEQTIDGVLTSTDRVLVKSQTSGSENGIYVTAAGAWARSADANTAAELVQAAVFVQEGSLNSDHGFINTVVSTFTLGATVIPFVQFTGLGQVTAGAGLSKSNDTMLIDSTVVTLTGAQVLSNKVLGTVLDCGGFILNNAGEPLSASDLATKNYVDGVTINGVKWKSSVKTATTVNVTLSGEQTLDGILTSLSRVLVKNQTLGEENGIYVTAAGAWARSTDADLAAEILQAAVFIEEGSTQSDSGWVNTTNGPITLGTTSLTFTQFTGLGQIIAGTGLDKVGNILNIDNTVVTLTGVQSLSNKSLGANLAGNGFDLTNIGQLELGTSLGQVTINNVVGDGKLALNYRVGSFGGATRSLDFSSDDINANRIYNWPNAAGTFALTSSTSGIINIVDDTTPQLGGELDAGAHSIGFTQSVFTQPSNVLTGNFKNSNKATITLTASCTSSSWTNPTNPCNVSLKVVQGGAGSFTVVWPVAVKWPGGTAPTLTTTVGGIDIVSFYWDGTNYFGAASLAFA